MSKTKVRDFTFKRFKISQQKCAHKVGTDGVLLGAWVNVNDVNSILDIGTGSGLIALMLAQRTNESVKIDAIEIQSEDAEEAQQNFNESPWKNRLRIFNSSLQDFESEFKYDLIVSNPPFFMNSFLPPKEARTLVRHTTSLPFNDLIKGVKDLLNPDGRFAIILPYDEGQRFNDMANLSGIYLNRICEFRSRKNKAVERLLIEFSFTPKLPVKDELILLADEKGEEWSDQYKQLTKDFYLKL